MRVELVYRSLEPGILREYLVKVGGVAQSDHYVSGDGWSAILTELELPALS